MCGRFALHSQQSILEELFGPLERSPESPAPAPRYNITPTQPVAAVRFRKDSAKRELSHFHWGLIPFWAKTPKMAARMINARSETVHEKPAFRAAFRRRRCLIPADGFYEWKKPEKGGKTKQPYFIHMKENRPFALAGLWEHWQGKEGEEIESCAILTTSPNDLLKTIHDRMPVILNPLDFELWLDGDVQDPDRILPLLIPFPEKEMAAQRVSTTVNNPRNQGADCMKPL